MTAPPPTGEQQAIIDASQSGADLVIEAGAGTGKTSTLRLVAATQPRRRGLYVAYNKAIATDAKRSFPTSVTCATAHSLAFRAVGRRFAHRLNGPRMPARQTAKTLGINPDPKNGGTADPVTYIVFPGSKSGKIEDHTATVTKGRQVASTFVSKN